MTYNHLIVHIPSEQPHDLHHQPTGRVINTVLLKAFCFFLDFVNSTVLLCLFVCFCAEYVFASAIDPKHANQIVK